MVLNAPMNRFLLPFSLPNKTLLCDAALLRLINKPTDCHNVIPLL